MAPLTKEALEIRELKGQLTETNKRLDEMTDGFRMLSLKNKQLLEFLKKTQQELEGVKVDIVTLKTGNAKKSNQDYESKVTRF